MRTLVSRIVFHVKGARRASIGSSMSDDIGVDAVDPAEHVRGQELVMVGEVPVERSAQLILLLYLGKRGRPKVRIHGRPRSDRKRRFLLSAVAPSTSARHPRKARPINWAQRGGLASGREMSPDAEATFHRASCTLGNQVVGASDGAPFHQERRPTRVCRAPGAGKRSACRSKHTAGWVIVSLDGDRIVAHRRVQRAPPPPLTAPPSARSSGPTQSKPRRQHRHSRPLPVDRVD